MVVSAFEYEALENTLKFVNPRDDSLNSEQLWFVGQR